MNLIITILPMVTQDLPISPRFTPYNFLSRCKFSTLTTRQPMVEFFLLTFPRFPLRKKEHKSYFGKNRTHDFRTSRCAAYLLDHPGDTLMPKVLRSSRKHPIHSFSCPLHAACASHQFSEDHALRQSRVLHVRHESREQDPPTAYSRLDALPSRLDKRVQI